jgi:hypothetical protein
MSGQKQAAEDTRVGRRILGELTLRGAFGRKNAVPRAEILKVLNREAASLEFEDDTIVLGDAAFRGIYRELPICSNEAGLYIPETVEDLDDFEAYLRAKAAGLFRRIRIVQAKRPDLGPLRSQFVLSFDAEASPPAGPPALRPRCRTCAGTGKVTLGEHRIDRGEAFVAGDANLEGRTLGIEYATCPTCHGKGELGAKSGEGK